MRFVDFLAYVSSLNITKGLSPNMISSAARRCIAHISAGFIHMITPEYEACMKAITKIKAACVFAGGQTSSGLRRGDKSLDLEESILDAVLVEEHVPRARLPVPIVCDRDGITVLETLDIGAVAARPKCDDRGLAL
jgi:hypothetical protein